MAEGANSTAMVKDDLVAMMKSIVLDESAVIKKEPNIGASSYRRDIIRQFKTENEADEAMFESCENMKKEKVTQNEACVMPEIDAVIKEELMTGEEIIEQHASSTTGTLVNKEIITQGNNCSAKRASKVHNCGLSEATNFTRRLCECGVCSKLYFESKFPLSHHKLINKRKQKGNILIKHTFKKNYMEHIIWSYRKYSFQNLQGDRTPKPFQG